MLGTHLKAQFWVEELESSIEATADAIFSSEKHIFCSSLASPSLSSWCEGFDRLDDQQVETPWVSVFIS